MSFTADEIECAADGLGGLLDQALVVSPFDRILADLTSFAETVSGCLRKHMNEKWATRPLQLLFVNSHEVNAQASKLSDTDLILISSGAVQKIYGTMCGMLAQRSFLPSIGDSTEEEISGQALGNGLPAFPILRDDFDAHFTHCFPNNQLRMTYAMHLASMALQFLILHEIGHVIAGHIDLQERSKDCPPLHILECDADAFASHMGSFLDLHSAGDKLWTDVFGLADSSAKYAAFNAHSIAISILFRMLDGNDSPPQCIDPGYHPHPTIRSCVAISRSFSLAVVAGRLANQDFERLRTESVFCVEEAWVALGLPGQRFGEISSWRDEVAKFSKELMREYEKWKPKLTEHVRLPPQWHDAWPEN